MRGDQKLNLSSKDVNTVEGFKRSFNYLMWKNAGKRRVLLFVGIVIIYEYT